MVLHRYGTLKEVYDLPFPIGDRLIKKAIEEEQNELVHRQWCAQLPFMSKETYVPFPEYRDNVTGRNIDTRPTGVMVAELLKIQSEMEGAINGT